MIYYSPKSNLQMWRILAILSKSSSLYYSHQISLGGMKYEKLQTFMMF